MVEATVAEFGRIDILINNAGVGFEEEAVDTVSMDIVQKTFDVNVFGLWRCCQSVGCVMVEQGDGKVVNIASIEGLTACPNEPGAAYCAAKGAIINFSRELAVQWAGYGVKVHCVAPGWFPTELTAFLFEDQELERKALERIPLGRWGGENDIKGLAVFLSSPASDFLIGHPIIFDGGQLLT
jgi:gluconate 5-dehydrogenase